MLYQLLAGAPPYRITAGDLAGLVEETANRTQVEKPSTQVGPEAGAARATTQKKLARRLRGDLDAIVLKALASDATVRYQSAGALADDLRRYLRGDPVHARPARPTYLLTKFVLKHRIAIPATALAVAIVAVAVGYALTRPPGVEREAATRAAAPITAGTALAASDKSIAVLPFADMSEKKDQEYFSDGLTEELIGLLAKVPQVKVIARTSSFSFKGKPDDIPTIARKLNVANILEGSVRKSGTQLRVTAQLVRADSGQGIWSETYDRQLKDVFQVQDEIAGAVVAALKVQLLPSQRLLSSDRTDNLDAYVQYLLGRQHLDDGTLDGCRRAIEAFNRAIALDPSYAAAYAGLARAEYSEADSGGNPDGIRRAQAAADRAIALAPELGSGYAARGGLRASYGWDWKGARADFEKALALDAGDQAIRDEYAHLLASQGLLPDAIETVRRATDLDPLRVSHWDVMGELLTADRQFAAAHQALGKALEIEPQSGGPKYLLAELELVEGRTSEALAGFRSIGNFVFRLSGIAIGEAVLGHAKESQQALDELIAGGDRFAAYQIAQVYAGRGENDKAFEWLTRAYRQRDGGLSATKYDPLLASLHSDPRFGGLLRKLNLPD